MSFTDEEKETLEMSAYLFVSTFFPQFNGIEKSDARMAVDVLTSRTMTEKEILAIGSNKSANKMRTLNAFRNELCYFMFRNLYALMGHDINKIPSPTTGVFYGDFILNAPNKYMIENPSVKRKMKKIHNGQLEWE